jgi:hypothetical protein
MWALEGEERGSGEWTVARSDAGKIGCKAPAFVVHVAQRSVGKTGIGVTANGTQTAAPQNLQDDFTGSRLASSHIKLMSTSAEGGEGSRVARFGIDCRSAATTHDWPPEKRCVLPRARTAASPLMVREHATSSTRSASITAGLEEHPAQSRGSDKYCIAMHVFQETSVMVKLWPAQNQ